MSVASCLMYWRVRDRGFSDVRITILIPTPAEKRPMPRTREELKAMPMDEWLKETAEKIEEARRKGL